MGPPRRSGARHVDEYWQQTSSFSDRARGVAERSASSADAAKPAQRRDSLIKAEAARLARKDRRPVIAAGSTGSIPATAELIATIARLPHGAVVLPGPRHRSRRSVLALIGGDEANGSCAGAGHPQFAMQALLTRIGITRDAVVNTRQTRHGRERLVSEALRPAAATEQWQCARPMPAFGRARGRRDGNYRVIEAANAEEESLAIAVALREAVDTTDKTAALVTPIARSPGACGCARTLEGRGRRIPAARRSPTPSGHIRPTAAETALGELAPVTLLALLKHPLLRLGTRRRERAIATLERAMLRGPRPRAGSDGLAHALATFRAQLEKHYSKQASDLHPVRSARRTGEDELAAAAELVARAWRRAGAAREARRRQSLRWSDVAARHREVIAGALASKAAMKPFSRPRRRKARQALDELARASRRRVGGDRSDYVELFVAAHRRPCGAPPRVRACACAFSDRSKRASPVATASCSAA